MNLEVIAADNSLIQSVDGIVCEENREKKRLCYPRTQMEDITDKAKDTKKGSDNNTVFFMHVRANNIGRSKSEEVINKHSGLMKALSDKSHKLCTRYWQKLIMQIKF